MSCRPACLKQQQQQRGLERWLTSGLLSKRTQILFLTPMSGGSQQRQRFSSLFWLLWAIAYMCIYAHTDIHTQNLNKCSKNSYFSRNSLIKHQTSKKLKLLKWTQCIYFLLWQNVQFRHSFFQKKIFLKITFIPKVEQTKSMIALSWLLWKYMATNNNISPKEAETPDVLLKQKRNYEFPRRE